jgi:hypothetical protein
VAGGNDDAIFGGRKGELEPEAESWKLGSCELEAVSWKL